MGRIAGVAAAQTHERLPGAAAEAFADLFAADPGRPIADLLLVLGRRLLRR